MVWIILPNHQAHIWNHQHIDNIQQALWWQRSCSVHLRDWHLKDCVQSVIHIHFFVNSAYVCPMYNSLMGKCSRNNVYVICIILMLYIKYDNRFSNWSYQYKCWASLFINSKYCTPGRESKELPRQNSNISHTLVCKTIVDHSDVVGASQFWQKTIDIVCRIAGPEAYVTDLLSQVL